MRARGDAVTEIPLRSYLNAELSMRHHRVTGVSAALFEIPKGADRRNGLALVWKVGLKYIDLYHSDIILVASRRVALRHLSLEAPLACPFYRVKQC